MQEFINIANLKSRLFSAVLIVLLIVSAVIIGGLLYYALMLLIMIGMLYEWYNITRASWLALAFGSIVIPISIASLMLLKLTGLPSIGLLYYFLVIWAVDTFAMLGGNFFGGPKLAPRISPRKTWSGLLSGIVSACFIMALLLNCLPESLADRYNFNHYSINKILFVIVLGFIAQMSDLLVSIFKRRFGVKESGTIIPGHGGVLDRFDSIILTAPLSLIVWLYYVL